MGKAEQNMSNIDHSLFSLYYVAPPDGGTELLPLYFSMVGDEQCAPTYRVCRGHAEISVMILVLAGAGQLSLHGRMHTLSAGDMLVLPQGEAYQYESARTQPWHILWFNMTGELFPHWLDQYGLRATPVYPQVNQAVTQAMWEGVNLCRGSLPHDQLQDALCTLVYGILLSLRRQFNACAKPAGPAQELRFMMDEQITTHPDAPFSMSEAASRLNFSQRQLERLFQAEFQRTPYGYFLQQKLLLAKQYLRNTRLSRKGNQPAPGVLRPLLFLQLHQTAGGRLPQGLSPAVISQGTPFSPM